jgi:hypothetical protein
LMGGPGPNPTGPDKRERKMNWLEAHKAKFKIIEGTRFYTKYLLVGRYEVHPQANEYVHWLRSRGVACSNPRLWGTGWYIELTDGWTDADQRK